MGNMHILVRMIEMLIDSIKPKLKLSKEDNHFTINSRVLKLSI